MLTTSRINPTLEQDRPTEWLRALIEGKLYRWLVDDAGSMAVAAYRLSRARGRVQPMPNTVPTLREVLAAAREIHQACGVAIPATLLLVDECEHRGLPLIAPIGTPVAA